MTSRIVAAVLALITAALASMAIPLGLLTAAQDRRDFRADTLASARSTANLAEEGIGANFARDPAQGLLGEAKLFCL